jgi:hypothetical protein
LGLLDGNASVQVIRLSRDADNQTCATNISDIKNECGNPIFKETSLLQALFHNITIVFRLYRMALERTDKANLDVHFIPSFGKARISTIASSLIKFGLNCKIIADMDMFNDGISKLVSSIIFDNDKKIFTGVYSQLMNDIKTSKKKVENEVKIDDKQLTQLNGQIANLFPENRRVDCLNAYTKTSTKLKNSIGKEKQLSIKKRGVVGLTDLVDGDRVQKFLNLINGYGVFLVPCGELEGFVIGNNVHGPQILDFILDDLENRVKWDKLKEFIISVIS